MKITLIGHLGADAETFETANGQFYSFRVATNDYDRKLQQEVTTWVRVTASQSTVGNKKLLKGSHVVVIGNIKVGTYQTKTGETAVSIDVFADSISYVGGKSNSDGNTQTTSETTVSTGAFKQPVVAETTVTKEPEDDLPF